MQTVHAMITGRRSVARRRGARRRRRRPARSMVCGCNTDQQVTSGVAEVPTDYRLRHPITLQESQSYAASYSSAPIAASLIRRSARRSWRSAWAGSAPRPAASWSSVRSAAATSAPPPTRCTRSSRSWPPSGLPPQSIAVQTYDAATGPSPAPVRIGYPEYRAQAGPMRSVARGHRPELQSRLFRKSAAVELWLRRRSTLSPPRSPIRADLVQPRAETPAYTMRRATVLQKYTSGQSTATEESSTTRPPRSATSANSMQRSRDT